MPATTATPRNGPAAEAGSPLLLTILLAMANFMQVLDLTIANVSLPAITSDLGAVPSQGAWIVTSFAAANAVSIPLTGWLADRFGQVRMFTLATLMFTLSSLLCGLSWSLEALIVSRVIQGAATGFMVPLSLALLLRVNPPDKQGMALVVWSMTTTIAPIFGPVLGGWITDNWHWSWIFLINVPFGALVAFAIWELLKDRESPLKLRPLDGVGLVLLVVWVGSLQIMLDKGNELDWFHSGFIVMLAIIAALGAVLFFIWELTDEHPIVDLSLFRLRNFGPGMIALSAMFASFQATNVAFPLWLQTDLSYTAQWAGFVLAPMGIGSLLLAPVVGRFLNRVDPRILISIGFCFFATALLMRAGFNSGVDYLDMVFPQLVMGCSGGFIFAPLIGTSLGSIDPSRMSQATGTQNFIRTMAGSIGTSLAISFWSQRDAFHRSRLVESVTPYSDQVADYTGRLTDAGMPLAQVMAGIDRQIGIQSSTLALNDLHWLCAWLMIAAIGSVWLIRKPFRGGTAKRQEPVVVME